MNISSAGNIASVLSQSKTDDAVALTMLKKANDIQAQGALQLIQALPQLPSKNPPNLGNSVNTFA
jgi:hypothetical protein